MSDDKLERWMEKNIDMMHVVTTQFKVSCNLLHRALS